MRLSRRSSWKLIASVALFLVTLIAAIELSARPAISVLPGAKAPTWLPGLPVQLFGWHRAPTDFELLATSRLPQPLVPVNSKTTPKDNRELAVALTNFYSRQDQNDLKALTQYVESHPHSPWKVALLANLGAIYLNSGYPSQALTAFGAAWELGKNATGEKARMMVDYALGEYALMHGRLGRFQELDTLFAQIQERQLVGPGTELMRGAREGRSMMARQPGIAFRCGPLALEAMARVLKKTLGLKLPDSERLMSTHQGTSLAQLADYAPKLGLDVKLVKRSPGAPMIVPAVVHWKVGHFSAITQQSEGKYFSEDPTFRRDIWLDAKALDAETTGYALVAANTSLPPGWQEASREIGQSVWGKGYIYGLDPTCTSGSCPVIPCHPSNGGMAGYSFQPQLVSLNIDDTPLKSTPAYGPGMAFKVDYNQREYGQPTSFTYANLGPKWTHNWTAYVEDQPGNPSASVVVYYRSGGSEQYVQDTSVTTGWQSLPSQRRSAVLKRSGSQYELDYPDGSKEIYTQTNGGTSTDRKIFLSQVLDQHGNAVTLQYGQGTYLLRLVSVTDATGAGQLSFSYRSDDPFKIASVTAKATPSESGRTATLSYTKDSSGVLRLTTISDPQGIVSSFAYTGDFINALTTPYGTTTFTTGVLASSNGYSASGFDYYLEAKDPTGQKERVEFRDDISGLANTDATLASIVSSSTPTPSGMNAVAIYRVYRESFYWNKKQMSQFQGITVNGTLQATAADLDLAQWSHWLHGLTYADVGQGGSYVASPVVEATKAPLEGWVSYYYGQATPYVLNANERARLTEMGRVLDDGSSQVAHWRYNQNGNITCVQDPAGRLRLYTYTPDGVDVTGVYQVTASGQSCDNLTGNNQTRLASYTYFSGDETLSGKHLVKTATDAAGNTTTYAYDSHGRLTQQTNAKGEVTTYTYDSTTGKLASIQKGGATLGSYTYDSAGRVLTATGPAPSSTLKFAYDNLNRLTSTTYPDGTSQQLVYNILDVSQLLERDGTKTTYSYNANRQLISETDANNHTTQYSWCGCGALQAIIDPRNSRTSWTYDLQGRPLSKTYPDGGIETYGYETSTSRLKQFKDPKGQVTKYFYNVDNSLQEVAYDAPAKVAFDYDPYFRRTTSMTDGTGTTTYSYDSAQRLASVDGPLSGAIDEITYSYDALNRVASESVAGATQYSAVYDDLGRLYSTNTAIGQFGYSYDGATDRLTALSYPNGQKTSISYYDALTDFLPHTIQNLTRSGANLSSWTMTSYDGKRNLTGLNQQLGTAPATTSSYSYDPTGQLTNVAGSQSDSWVYDAAGNPTTVTQSGRSLSHAYNSSNQLTDSNYTYDANGNLTSNGSQTFGWDVADRLTTVSGNGLTSKIVYDGLGRFVRITDIGSSVNSDVRYLWDDDQLVAQLDAAGTTVLKRYFPNGVQVGTKNYYYTRDVLGSVREVTDQAGAVQGSSDYTGFGIRIPLTETGGADFGYGGYFYHAASGLYLTRYRAYNPTLGRFLDRDPSGEVGGLNLYAYTDNNPVNFTDPSGNGPVGTAIGASVGAGLGATAGTVLGGVGGTFLEPGGGTIVGGISGEQAGAALGAGVGGYIGNQLEDLFGNLGCPLFQSTPNNENSDRNDTNEPKKKKPKKGATGKQGATDIPSWARGQQPNQGESGKDFAKRLLDERYGPGNYKTGPGSEYNQLKKYGDRHF